MNEHGLSVGLLNSWEAERPAGAPEPISRGLLVRELLASAGADDLGERLTGMELARYRGFRGARHRAGRRAAGPRLGRARVA